MTSRTYGYLYRHCRDWLTKLTDANKPLRLDGKDVGMTGGSVEDVQTDETQADAVADSSRAFQQLSDERRLAILRRLAVDGPSSFSTLFEHSDSDTSAGFAYHLRQLADEFVRQREDETWELSAQGRQAAQTVESGAFTTGVDHDEMALEEACPLCHERELTLAVEDSVASVACSACDGAVLQVSVPPRWGTHTEAALPETLDSYYRNRVRLFSDGVCPDCGGAVESTATTVSPETGHTTAASAQADRQEDTAADLAQFSFSCRACGSGLDCPATLTVLDNPAVAGFYDDHEARIETRPVWNVGPEWRERVLSTEPWCLLVSTRQGDEVLELYVGGDAAVHESRRRSIDESVVDSATGSGDSSDDVAA